MKISSSIATNRMDVVLANWPFVIYKAGPSRQHRHQPRVHGSYAVASTMDANGAISATNDVIDLVPNSYYPDARSV